jgi:hypothetical protein
MLPLQSLQPHGGLAQLVASGVGVNALDEVDESVGVPLICIEHVTQGG